MRNSNFEIVPKFKIKHLQTGLYYKPNGRKPTGLVEGKSNLCKKGKTYSWMPDVVDGLAIFDNEKHYIVTKAKHWQVVEVRG